MFKTNKLQNFLWSFLRFRKKNLKKLFQKDKTKHHEGTKYVHYPDSTQALATKTVNMQTKHFSLYKYSPRASESTMLTRICCGPADRHGVSIFLSIPLTVDYAGQINYCAHSTGSRPTNSLSRSYRQWRDLSSNMPRRQATECTTLRAGISLKYEIGTQRAMDDALQSIASDSSHSNQTSRWNRASSMAQLGHAKNSVFDTCTYRNVICALHRHSPPDMTDDTVVVCKPLFKLGKLIETMLYEI